MSSFQIVGLIMVLIGIITLVFCRQVANYIRSFYYSIGIDVAEWVGIVGLIIPSIIFIIWGLTMVLSPNMTFRS